MDAMDRYLERLDEPKVRAFHRKIHRVDDDPDLKDWVVTEDHVATAEEALGVPLPPSYKKLVTSVQPHDADYGLLWVWDGETAFAVDIVTEHQSELNGRPTFLIAVEDHENGNAVCFDTRHPDERGEYPIVHFDHEIHDSDSTEFETLDRDLGEYLLRTLYTGPEQPGEETAS